MKTVLVVGDSLSMVRPSDSLCLEQTYPFMLQQQLGADFYVVNASQRANDSSRVVSDNYLSESICAAKAEVIILQLGIVDCTPRLFSEMQKKILAGLRLFSPIRRGVDAYIKRKSLQRYDLTKKKKMVNVSLADFESNIARFFEIAREFSPGVKFVVINVLYPGQVMLSRNYGLIENVESYNQCLANLVDRFSGRLVNLFEYTRNSPHSVLSDGHHIGNAAHQFIAGEALRAIKIGDSK